MSVIRQDTELADFVNELESKVLVLMAENKTIKKKLKKIEAIAKKHGVNVETQEVETDACIIV
tara:strand:- start:10489 stop:10677 length:189 start_codon:yes stop_codon:yes gene_type:complete